MTRNDLAARILQLSHIRGDFLLRSGKRSTEYFDKYLFEADAPCLKAIAAALVELLPAECEMLAGLELGGVPIATLLAQHGNTPLLFVRKKAKVYGTCKLAEGPNFKGRTVVIIEDVITSGGAVLDAVRELREAGAQVQHVLCVIDRESGGRENLKEAALEMRALYTISELKAASH